MGQEGLGRLTFCYCDINNRSSRTSGRPSRVPSWPLSAKETSAPAWFIDAVHGDQYPGSGAGSLAAVAGYPHLTVPMGAVRGLPVGLSFIGPQWSDGLILSLGYAYEQASRRRIDPPMIRSVEESEEVARHLRPLAR
jgi:amidase